MKRQDIRNVAIIAHVDHGKTTLVDGLLRVSGSIRQNQEIQDRVMDSGDLERERGITILSKNTAVNYKGTKINIIDTPGHADFGGEVERVLKMCDGVILLVDAFEGPMPQTKFVLRKAVDLGLPAILCINKVDRADARVDEVKDELLDLFIAVDAPESYLDSPIIYASAREGWASRDQDKKGTDMAPMMDMILEAIPAPEGDSEGPFKLLISTCDYNDYVGRIGIGKIGQGQVKVGDHVTIKNYNNPEVDREVKITKIFEFDGLKRVPVESSGVGSIIAVSGVEGIEVGDTLCDPEDPSPLPFVKISEPTLQMTFSVNDSPFAGQSGKYVTSRHLRARLFKELETDVSLRVEEGEGTDSFKVSGRGELHLSVLIEKMRRESYEFQVSKPEVLFRTDEKGHKMEPIEEVVVDIDQEFSGAVIQALGRRKGELQEIKTTPSGYTRLIFNIPARGLIGYRQQLLTDTRGTGVLNNEFLEYAPYKGEIPRRPTGSLIAFETGEATGYGLFAAQDRGQLFIEPGVEVYEGQVVGANPKGLDIEVNVCKKKALTNIRSAASDEALKLSPPLKLSLEQMMEFVEEDELIEVTPDALRLRKAILDTNKRYKSKKYS
ncbi:translational GTPase TypA [Kallipyga massiliensis]|uniref:translational GTPase TypA n=1 Tax=Kallipyga massiliensis TaxID=1472764 RepID=UPI0026EDF003|nr:translational GTPase TypA [Kallipyga massiliensis]